MNRVAIAIGASLSLVSCSSAQGAEQVSEATVRLAMARVESILGGEGYPVAGFASRPAPAVEFADCRLNPEQEQCRRLGIFQWKVRTIVISDRETQTCIPVTLAYELTRYAVQLYSLTGERVGFESGDYETDLARAIAAVVMEEDHHFDCLADRHAFVIGTYRASFAP